MKLKVYDRPQYAVNSIFEAVCQLRFSPILRIRETPSSFQEHIRQKYPLYLENTGLPNDLPPPMQEMLKQTLTLGDRQYQFSSEDNVWQVSLGTDYISLTNFGEYTTFEEFNTRLQEILVIFNEEYKPSGYVRIGLRYKNVIARTVFPELGDIAWPQLVPIHVSPELHDEENVAPERVASFEKRICLEEAKEKVNVHYVFGHMQGTFKSKNFNEKAYMIDINSYTEEKIDDAATVSATISSFKQNIQNLFRHSISEELHDAFQRTSQRSVDTN